MEPDERVEQFPTQREKIAYALGYADATLKFTESLNETSAVVALAQLQIARAAIPTSGEGGR